MQLIPSEEKYWEFIRELRNDSRNQHGFIINENITSEEQINYMQKHNDDYYICLNDENQPIGFIGNVNNDIRICVKFEEQNKKIGQYIIKEYCKLQNKILFAKVKIKNISSQKAFEKCGFKPEFIIYKYEKQSL